VSTNAPALVEYSSSKCISVNVPEDEVEDLWAWAKGIRSSCESLPIDSKN